MFSANQFINSQSDRGKDWEDCLKQVADFDTAEVSLMKLQLSHVDF